jgi:DDE family transposase
MQQQENIEQIIQEKFLALAASFDEHSRRLWAGTEAKALGYGGQTVVANATGVSRHTVHAGLREVERMLVPCPEAPHHVRRPGGGRKSLREHDPLLVAHREALVDPTSRGDPVSPLRWPCKSTRQLATALRQQGHHVGRQTVAT